MTELLTLTRRREDGTQETVTFDPRALEEPGFDVATVAASDWRTLEEARNSRIAAIKAAAAERIERDWPLWRQLNVIREGGAGLAAMTQAIDRIRDESNQAEAAVMAAPSPAAVDAVDR